MSEKIFVEEKLDVCDEEAQHFFSNLACFHVNPEEICFGLGIRDFNEANRVHIHTYVHLTIPHFLRFAQLVNKQIDFLVEKGVVSREPEQ